MLENAKASLSSHVDIFQSAFIIYHIYDLCHRKRKRLLGPRGPLLLPLLDPSPRPFVRATLHESSEDPVGLPFDPLGL